MISAREAFGQRWGWYQQVVHLADGDITKFDDVFKLNYAECFTKIMFDMHKQEVESIEARKQKY